MTKSNKKTLNIEMIIGIAAIITSLCALVVSIIQTSSSMKQQEAAVFPYLSTNYDDGPGYTNFNIFNDGLGPAFINQVTVKMTDTTYNQIATPFLNFHNQIKMKNKPSFSKSELHKGWVIKSGEKRTLYSIQHKLPYDTISVIKYDSLFNSRFKNESPKIEIFYNDIYGNCFLYKSPEGIVKRVEKCPNEIIK
jgi:hypothetical protein